MRTLTANSLGLLAVLVASSVAQADPLPGRDLLKFSQQPMIATTIPDTTGVVTTYGGHDELSTAYGFPTAAGTPQDYSGRFMADDFADKLTSPVVHVKWWGSYSQRHHQPPDAGEQVSYLVRIRRARGPGPSFSHPGQPLLNQTVKRGPLRLAPGRSPKS